MVDFTMAKAVALVGTWLIMVPAQAAMFWSIKDTDFDAMSDVGAAGALLMMLILFAPTLIGIFITIRLLGDN